METASIGSSGKRLMSAQEAKAILAEYPDADLSAFEVQGDVEALAREAGAETLAKLAQRLGGRSKG